jgi:tyrosyl-tRNA synthetase
VLTKKQKIEEVLNRGVEKIYPSKKNLRDVLVSSKKIRLYQGFDPSMPNLHLGNMVGVLKLKQFQDLGHEVIFLVGDFTGMIGDPTDRTSTRKKLTRKEVLKNAKNWKNQAKRFLKFSGKNPAKIMFNSQWSDKISFKELIEITSHFTVQRLLERNFFQRRIKRKKPIFLHEFLYPVAQAVDCVKMDVDLEIGGSDQTFNMLMGRHLMKALKRKEKLVLTTKLLVDKEGQKVGKTTGIALFLNASPTDMFGKVMAFPDEAIIPGFELLSIVPMKKVGTFKKELEENKINPMELKQHLALEIVKLNYGEKKAKKAQKEFARIFKRKGVPTKIPETKIEENSLNILELLTKMKLAFSKSEAKRLILQGGVKIDKKLQKDWRKKVKIKKGMIVQIGKKRFARIK